MKCSIERALIAEVKRADADEKQTARRRLRYHRKTCPRCSAGKSVENRRRERIHRRREEGEAWW